MPSPEEREARQQAHTRVVNEWIEDAHESIGVQGTEGFAEVLTGAGWRAVTRSGGFQSGEGIMSYDLDMPPYVDDIARWLDDDRAVHPCHGESAYKGFEIVMGIVRSVTEQVVRNSPRCVLVVVSNPLDAMCHVAHPASGFSRERVIGMVHLHDLMRAGAV